MALVFLDPAFPEGRVAGRVQPQLLVTDLGVTRGDGVFETMLAVGGTVRKMPAHLNRLAGSAEALDLVIPGQEEWQRAIATAVNSHRSEHPPTDPATDELRSSLGDPRRRRSHPHVLGAGLLPGYRGAASARPALTSSS